MDELGQTCNKEGQQCKLQFFGYVVRTYIVCHMTFLEYIGPLAAGAHMQIWANSISNKTNDSSGWWHSNPEWIHHCNHWATTHKAEYEHETSLQIYFKDHVVSPNSTHKVVADPVG